MPVRPLPPNPSLEHLKYQAKDLLRGIAANDPGAAQRIREFHPGWTKASDETPAREQMRPYVLRGGL